MQRYSTGCIASACGRKLKGMRAIYSIHLAIYSTSQEGITSTKQTRGALAAVLLRELNSQLLKYLLDMQTSKSISLPIFKPQMGSIEVLSFLIITP